MLTSGIYITIAHQDLKLGRYANVKLCMIFTIIHGIIFSAIQLFEYRSTPFCINDSVYGSIFYLLTGFHGIHVLVGTIFLIVCLIRLEFNHFSTTHHVGFVCAV